MEEEMERLIEAHKRLVAAESRLIEAGAMAQRARPADYEPGRGLWAAYREADRVVEAAKEAVLVAVERLCAGAP